MPKYEEWCEGCKFQDIMGCADCTPCYYGAEDKYRTKIIIESDTELDSNHLKNVIKHSFPKTIVSLIITKYQEVSEYGDNDTNR